MKLTSTKLRLAYSNDFNCNNLITLCIDVVEEILPANLLYCMSGIDRKITFWGADQNSPP